MALNKAQQDYLIKTLDEIYETFIASDEGLKDSTCSCCEDKRNIQKTIEGLSRPKEDTDVEMTEHGMNNKSDG